MKLRNDHTSPPNTMKNGDLLTLKAFIAAYEANDRPPIPELAEIRANLDQRVKELDGIACNHNQLCKDYKKARTLLTAAASSRKAGTYVPPIGDLKGDESKDIENSVHILDQETKEKLQSRLPSEQQ